MLVILFLIPMATPLIGSTDAGTSGRAAPDFGVTILTLEGAGSVNPGTGVILEPASHNVRVTVRNTGDIQGSASLQLVHKGSPTAGEYIVTTIALGNLPASSTSNPIIIPWTATTGDGQTLFARIYGNGDSNPANNEQRMDFNVTDYHSAIVVDGDVEVFEMDDIDDDASRGMTRSVRTWNALVRNNGVRDISAQMKVTFTCKDNCVTPRPTHEFLGGTETLEAGSLFAPSVAESLSVTVDPRTFTGNYTMKVEFLYLGGGWNPPAHVANDTNVRASDYVATLSTLGDRSIEPGQTGTLTFLLVNKGLQDDFRVESIQTIPASRPWTGPPQSIATLAVNGTVDVPLTVTVPADEARGNAVEIILTIKSLSAEGYTLTTRLVVAAGEYHAAEVTLPITTTSLTPGVEGNITASVANTGNLGGFFTIDCGLSVSAPWELKVEETFPKDCDQMEPTYIKKGDSNDIVIKVKPPSIKFPLDPADFNLAGQPLQFWVTATPTGGGLPSAPATTNVLILPRITIDPGFDDDDTITLSKEWVRNGGGVVPNTLLNLEVRHNLNSDLNEELGVGIVIDHQFVNPNGYGFREVERWASVVNEPTITDLKPGDTYPTFLTISGPSQTTFNASYALAGTHSITMTLNPTLSAVHLGSNVQAGSITKTIQVIVPSILSGEIADVGVVTVPVANPTTIPLTLKNTGNEVTSYKLSAAGIPDGWNVTFNGTTNLIPELPSEVGNYPNNGSTHIKSGIELIVTTNDTAPQTAGEDYTLLPITVEDQATGVIISEYQLQIKVGALRNASLLPSTQNATLNINDVDVFRTIQVKNTGNSQTAFYVGFDTSDATGMIFELDSNPSFILGAGRTEVIRVAIQPTSSAKADVNYTAIVLVTDASGAVNASATIVANLSKSETVVIAGPAIIAVTPGKMAKIEFNVTNTGNLQQSVIITPSFVTPTMDGNWTTDVSEIGMTLSINQTLAGQIVVSVPSLGGSQTLLDGAVYNLMLTVRDTSTPPKDLDTLTVQLRVGALFDLVAEGWPSVMEFSRQGTRTWDLMLTNTGNIDLSVDVGYSITRPGTNLLSNQWSMVDGYTSEVYLPVGIPVSHVFTLKGLDFQPDLSLTADLNIIFAPSINDGTIEGNYSATTSLVMSRFYTTNDLVLSPLLGDPVLEKTIPFSHIPSVLGDSELTPTTYELELCEAERLLDFSALNLNGADYPWTFSIVVPGADGTEVALPIDIASCASGTQGEAARITIPNRPAWETTDPLKILIDAPDRPNILSGDGWALTFRLYNTIEMDSHRFYEEVTFNFTLDVFADPMIEYLPPVTIQEGEEIELKLKVINAGTATTLGVNVALVCSDATILSQPIAEPMIGVLGPGAEMILVWRIQPDTIDWWTSSKESNCTATVDALYWDKNVVGNDVRHIDIDIESSSPGVSVSFIALIVCFLTSFILLRLTRQNEKFRLLATYAGVLGFGFAFHVLNVAYWGVAVLVLAALWIWRMSWTSGEEFKLIHEDYQRARRGVSTIYADHFDALRNSRRQLSVILAAPVLGFVAVVLGLPPQISNDPANLVSVLVYMAVVMVGVWVLILRADRAYGNLYGRLTDVEVKATRIERDLGDPARLFNELAGDGLNLDEIFGDVSTTATVGSLVNPDPATEEVNEDG
tara:strand:+ start:3243 stop:8186 length:4944 start_codon:yes stop_codon:yes gene_type:complete